MVPPSDLQEPQADGRAERAADELAARQARGLAAAHLATHLGGERLRLLRAGQLPVAHRIYSAK